MKSQILSASEAVSGCDLKLKFTDIRINVSPVAKRENCGRLCPAAAAADSDRLLNLTAVADLMN